MNLLFELQNKNKMETNGVDVCGNKVLKNLPFASYEDRIKSFENWPLQMIPAKENLARAGFYYLNIGDHVKCFYCNIGLKDWDRSDDAYQEHKKWIKDNSITCLFLEALEWDVKNNVKEEQTTTLKKRKTIETTIETIEWHYDALYDNNALKKRPREETILTCKVCIVKNVSHTIIPCGHTLCSDCIFQILKCPLCNGDFSKINKLYLS